jgi:hypothetical protein
MTSRTPRAPIDLAATTRDVKARVRRVIADLERIEQQRETLFSDPRAVWLDVTLSIHELEAATSQMKRAWWP